MGADMTTGKAKKINVVAFNSKIIEALGITQTVETVVIRLSRGIPRVTVTYFPDGDAAAKLAEVFKEYSLFELAP